MFLLWYTISSLFLFGTVLPKLIKTKNSVQLSKLSDKTHVKKCVY